MSTRFLVLLSIFFAQPVLAECYTATSPVRFCAAKSAGATAYDWHDDTGAYLATTPQPVVDLSCAGRLAVYARATAAGYAPSPPSQTSDTVYCVGRTGHDTDGDGLVLPADFTTGFLQAFKAGCRSCAVVNGVSLCPAACP